MNRFFFFFLLVAVDGTLKVRCQSIPRENSGSTDGSALSPRGVCTPNYFTGAHNFHSIYEFLPLTPFEQSYQLTRRIVERAAGG